MTESGGRSVLDRRPAWSGPVRDAGDTAVDAGIDGVHFEPLARHVDDRGWFVKPFQASAVAAAGGDPLVGEVFVSSSHRGVIRGLHFQEPPSDHAKTVTCLSGVIYDVVVDLRAGPQERRVARFRLDGDAPARLHLPSGVAHGFQALTDDAVVVYVTSTEHDPARDRGVRFDSVGIDWPLPPQAVSTRDQSFPAFDAYRWPGASSDGTGAG